MTEHLDPLLARLAPVDLEVLEHLASLLERIERKYVVASPVLSELLTEVSDGRAPEHLVLDIGGRRRFRYRTTYFDTAAFALYRAGATTRRHRTKVRTREYLDAGTATVEVKVKDGRGATVKHRLPHDPPTDELGAAGIELVRAASRMEIDPLELRPRLTTSYRRTTLLSPDGSARCTIDLDLRADGVDGRTVGLDAVVIETKTSRAAGGIDHWLWERGIRPARISKYSTTLALMHPELPGNKWHRTLTRIDGWHCATGEPLVPESTPAA